MKRLIYTIITAACIASCSVAPDSKKASIAVTLEPYRFAVEAIAGDNWEVISIVPKGSSPETFDLTPTQMIGLSKCYAYFSVGGLGFEDAWCKRIADAIPSLTIVDTSEGIERIDSDPHLWTSPDNMAVIATNICNAMCRIDSANRDAYTQRLQRTLQMINETDSLIDNAIDGGCFVIFHPSLTYFARAYGLEQIVIEEHGKEPSVAHVKEVIDMARNHKACKVLIQSEFDKSHATAIAKEIGCDIVQINPLNYDWQQEMLQIAEKLK